jgi:hypothetical protein
MESRDLLHEVLSSIDFRTIDEPLHSAVDLMKQLHGDATTIPAFVWGIYDRVKDTTDLTPKRVLWLCILKVVPAVAAYVVQTSPNPQHATQFIEWLGGEFELLLNGAYAKYDSQLDVFLAKCLLQYNA